MGNGIREPEKHLFNMLTRYQIESELSLAYLQAVAAKAACAVDSPRIDNDSVDAVISAKGRISPDGKISPRIEVQLKATTNWQVNREGKIAFPLPIKNYDELRADTLLPRLLVVLCLPKDENDWLVHSPEALVLRECAYYLNLKGLPERTNVDKPTVHLPTANLLSPTALKELMGRASKLEKL